MLTISVYFILQQKNSVDKVLSPLSTLYEKSFPKMIKNRNR